MANVDTLKQDILLELSDYAKAIENRESKHDKTDRESLLIMYAQASAISQFAKKLGYNAGLAYFTEKKVCKVWCGKV